MRSRIAVAIAASIALGTAAIPAQAQLGGLLKKAKEKAQQQVQQSGSQGAPSDAFGPALTEQTLPATLKGIAAEEAQLAKADSARLRHDALLTRRSALLDQHDAERKQWELASRSAESCQQKVIDRKDREHQAAMQQRQRELMADPAKAQSVVQAMMQMTQQVQAAMARGDTTEAKRIQVEFGRKQMGIDLHADTVLAVKECGAVPPKPAALVQADSLEAAATALANQQRDIEQAAQGEALAASGMTAAQFALARERIVNWYHEETAHRAIQQFGAEERKLLEAHRGEIERLKRVL